MVQPVDLDVEISRLRGVHFNRLGGQRIGALERLADTFTSLSRRSD